jgi:ferritin-like protein
VADTSFHEASESLRPETREMHRAIASLIEELEAVDWYAQRIDATDDPDLARILAHNRDEEKEHAAMTLEWIRRKDAKFDEHLRRFLFREGPIAGREEGESDDRSLAIGSLRQANGRHAEEASR